MPPLKLTKTYATYPEYKDSGIEWLGKIPKTWDLDIIQHLFYKVKRVGFENEQLLSVYRDHGVIIKSSRDDNHNQASEDLSSYQLVEPGDLAINKMKAWQGSLAISDHRGIVSPAYYICRPLSENNSRFFHYLFRSDIYIKQYERHSGGVRNDQWDLNYERFRKIEISFPNPETQKHIADYLDQKTALIDQTIEKKLRQIELLREKRTAVINQAVTKGLDSNAEFVESDIKWIGKIPKNWSLLPNKSFLKKRKYLVGDQESQFSLLSLTKKGVIVRDVSESKGKFSVDMSTYQSVKAGNLIFCLFDIEETPRTVGLSKIDGMITGAYTVFENSDLELMKYVEYFYIAMDNSKRLSYLYTGLRNTIPPYRFLSIKTPIPPHDIQMKITNFLDHDGKTHDQTISLLEKSIELLKEFKSSLISHVVTGKIKIDF